MNGASLDRFLNGPFVKTGCCQTTQNGPILKFFGQNYLKFNLTGVIFTKKLATESQTPKGTQYTGGSENFL